MGGPPIGVAAVRTRPGLSSTPLTRSKRPVRKAAPRRATVGRFLWTGTLVGLAIGGGTGLALHLEAQRDPRDWGELVYSFVYVVAGVAAGAATGSCLGALVGSLRLGGISAATWVVAVAGSLAIGGWLAVRFVFPLADDDGRLLLLLVGAVSAPVVVGIVARWAVRRSDAGSAAAGRREEVR